MWSVAKWIPRDLNVIADICTLYGNELSHNERTAITINLECDFRYDRLANVCRVQSNTIFTKSKD